MTDATAASPDRAPRLAVLVSHTHWDREWYLTYSQFRVKLIGVVRQVLGQLEREQEFRHFLLDGQSIILEDYLEIRPQDRARIENLVRRGALSLGPWYVLPDEFLVSGEATVRNLWWGHRVAAECGGVQKVGYMPDSFGHIAQLPQILRLAGIDSFVYTRGNGDELEELGSEYWWIAPDGSEVLAVNQLGGYCNAGGLGHRYEWETHTQRHVETELAVERIARLFATIPAERDCGVFLLNNGGDHFPPQRDFVRVLAALRAAFPRTEFRHGSLADYVAAVRDSALPLHRYQGELNRGRYHHILSGVWSARMYLKQQNDYAETLLSMCLEPMSAYVHFVLGWEYPRALIGYCWKKLMQNHPHDSICGCSTDEVHRQMLSRFAAVTETGEQVLRDILVRLTPTFADCADGDGETVICVANPLPVRRSEVVDRLVVLRDGAVRVENLRLFDSRGVAVPFEVIEHWWVDHFWGVDYRTELFGGRQRRSFQTYLDRCAERIDWKEDREAGCDTFLHVRFLARDLPPVGHAQFSLRGVGEAESEASGISSHAGTAAVAVHQHTIENEFLAVVVRADGTFDISDKVDGNEYRGLNRIEDTEDVGDEYDYCPAAESQVVTSAGVVGDVRVVDGGGLRGKLEVQFDLMLPESVSPSRRRRSTNLIPCRVRTAVALTAGSRLVEVETQIDNAAEDHRLRIEFPTGVASGTVISDGHFYINHRPIEQPRGDGWKQPPSGTHHQREFTLVQDDTRGLAVLAKGLPEIQASRSDAGEVKLSLTLFRAVGWLSRDDLDTRRRTGAGPTVPTPEAQCKGRLGFEYAVMPFGGDYMTSDVKGVSQRYRTPVLVVQGVEDGLVPGGSFLLQSSTDHTCVTAVKQHEIRDSLVVRLFNLTGRSVRETLLFGVDFDAVWRANLLEEREELLESSASRRLDVDIRPHEILTLELEPARSQHEIG